MYIVYVCIDAIYFTLYTFIVERYRRVENYTTIYIYSIAGHGEDWNGNRNCRGLFMVHMRWGEWQRERERKTHHITNAYTCRGREKGIHIGISERRGFKQKTRKRAVEREGDIRQGWR